MTMPAAIVAPPVETPALFGLFSAARLQPLTGHEQAGIRYEVLCDRPADRVWPGVCRPLPPGPPVTRTITLAMAGQRTGDAPNFTYIVQIGATVDTGPVRTLSVTVNGQPAVTITTGQPAKQVYSHAAEAVLNMSATDTATGTVEAFSVTQNLDGSLSATTHPFTVTDATDALKLTGAPAEPVEAIPFAVYAVEDCALGLTPDELVARARLRLQLTEQLTVEHTFWTGDHGVSPSLAGSTPEILNPTPGTPVSLVTAVSLVEEWLGQTTAYTGFLHVNRAAAAVAEHNQIARRAGNRLETALGTTWVFGGGYPRTGAAGTGAPTEPGHLWMFASRQPTVRRTEVFVPADMETGAFNYARNKNMIVAERVYVVDFPCQTAAVLVDLSKCACVGGAT